MTGGMEPGGTEAAGVQPTCRRWARQLFLPAADKERQPLSCFRRALLGITPMPRPCPPYPHVPLQAYILANTSVSSKSTDSIPWGKLLSRKEVWAIIICHFCHNWGTFILLTWMPTYYNQVMLRGCLGWGGGAPGNR